MHITDVEGELVTPTGAAIAAALRTQDQLPEKFAIQKVGMGAGKREYACVGCAAGNDDCLIRQQYENMRE